MAFCTRASFCGVVLLVLASQVMVTVTELGVSSLWWNLAVTDCGRTGGNCPNCAAQVNKSLTKAQEQQCYSDDDGHRRINAIAQGTQDAVIDCQLRYKNNKWNCSTFFSQDLFGKFVVEASTRETAIIQAYFAAGAVKGIATACHDQKLKNCVCSVNPPQNSDPDGNVVYYNCNEDYAYALTNALNFAYPDLSIEINTTTHRVFFNLTIQDGMISTNIDKRPLNSSSTTELGSEEPYTRILNDIHNTIVGVKAINQTEESCVCHGLSGACSVKTCYTKIKEISEIGDELRLKYSGAVKVVKEENSTKLKNAYPGRDPPDEDDLVYVSESPNFCVPDISKGVLGTKDRLCVPNGDGPDSCQNLCCDHGFYQLTVEEPNEVCRFVWCCKIECVTEGTKVKTEHRCNGPSNV